MKLIRCGSESESLFAQVEFEKEVTVTAIRIYEVLCGGAVKSVSARADDGDGPADSLGDGGGRVRSQSAHLLASHPGLSSYSHSNTPLTRISTT